MVKKKGGNLGGEKVERKEVQWGRWRGGWLVAPSDQKLELGKDEKWVGSRAVLKVE